jgi:hypothetical protein
MPANSRSLTSVKLFPRLATSKRNKRIAAPRVAPRPLLASSGTVENRESRRTQVRARLLHMILDNEQARRNDRRPTAG